MTDKQLLPGRAGLRAGRYYLQLCSAISQDGSQTSSRVGLPGSQDSLALGGLEFSVMYAAQVQPCLLTSYTVTARFYSVQQRWLNLNELWSYTSPQANLFVASLPFLWEITSLLAAEASQLVKQRGLVFLRLINTKG